MKFLTFVLPLFLILQSDGCSSDDDSDNELVADVNVLVKLQNTAVDCITESLTYIIDEGGSQRSIDIADDGAGNISFASNEGAAFQISALRTNDSSNTVLAFVSIQVMANPNDPDSVFEVFAFYDGCNNPEIIWSYGFN